MELMKGTHSIGPDDGTVTLNTYRAGAGAKIGHDLVLEAKRWNGKADIDPDNPAASNVQVTVDAGSLVVIDGVGGLKALSDGDRSDIVNNIQEKVLNTKKYPEISFESTQVEGAVPNLTVHGNLTIVGNTRPVTLALTIDGNAVVAKTTIVQSEFGIKPFSAMLGALKVRDAVEFEVKLNLPTA
jgi:polyisoprenoid-binding protein YceI